MSGLFDNLAKKWKAQRATMKGGGLMWHFPPAKKFLNCSLTAQIVQLKSEVKEVQKACRDYGNIDDHFVMEVWDVIHSAETLLRILSKAGIDITEPKNMVIAKNLQRGYYTEGGN